MVVFCLAWCMILAGLLLVTTVRVCWGNLFWKVTCMVLLDLVSALLPFESGLQPEIRDQKECSKCLVSRSNTVYVLGLVGYELPSMIMSFATVGEQMLNSGE